MHFEYDPKTKAYLKALKTFISQAVYPAEGVAAMQIRESDEPWFRPLCWTSSRSRRAPKDCGTYSYRTMGSGQA